MRGLTNSAKSLLEVIWNDTQKLDCSQNSRAESENRKAIHIITRYAFQLSNYRLSHPSFP